MTFVTILSLEKICFVTKKVFLIKNIKTSKFMFNFKASVIFSGFSNLDFGCVLGVIKKSITYKSWLENKRRYAHVCHRCTSVVSSNFIIILNRNLNRSRTVFIKGKRTC